MFRDRRLNDISVMVLSSYLGFSLDWWKNKHNTHHAVPNVLESATEAHDGDPDIDTLPFLAWSRKIARKLLPGAAVDSSLARLCVQFQAALYFPLLLFARMIWALQVCVWVPSGVPSGAREAPAPPVRLLP